MSEAGNLKQNGQHKEFNGYGGIEDLERYVVFELGTGWEQKKSKKIEQILNFKQTIFGPDNRNNCTLASITRIMKYYSALGFHEIPSDIHEIYAIVREIGVKHGYDPEKSGILRDLFIYTPFEIKTMVGDTWKKFGYERSKPNNIYIGKLKAIKNSIDDMNPVLLNIACGDYEGHTVTVTGYREFGSSREHCNNRTFVQVYDGWSEDVRYIDWKNFGITPASVTRMI
ncbi:hypothetical protein [Ruminiclostridium cellobioparum]|jgi:hypothetical protein|uniref:hypothetical protein n=1 Tax=Ruminiclostridium cellobioparum TaxID=29355 RepID=UPI000486CAFE|nr:hypothetical protein [Ruminiclostridium cellobioparum]